MADAALEILAVARHGCTTVVHTSAGRCVLSDDALRSFGLTHRDGLTDYNEALRCDARQRAYADAVRAVALMLRERISLHAACGKIGVSYHGIKDAAIHDQHLNDLLEEAKRNNR